MNLAAGSGTGSFASLRDGGMGLGREATGGGEEEGMPGHAGKPRALVGQAGTCCSPVSQVANPCSSNRYCPHTEGKASLLSHGCYLLKMQPSRREKLSGEDSCR